MNMYARNVDQDTYQSLMSNFTDLFLKMLHANGTTNTFFGEIDVASMNRFSMLEDLIISKSDGIDSLLMLLLPDKPNCLIVEFPFMLLEK